MRLLLTVVVSPVVFILVVWGFVRWQESTAIFHPVSYSSSEVQQLPSPVEFVEFDSSDGTRLSGFYQHAEQGAPGIILFHGNAGHALGRLGWLVELVPRDWNGLILDYRGYGRSAGTPTEQGVFRDGRAAVNYMRQRSDPDQLVYHGKSLGVPVATHAVEQEIPDGLILESGFPSGRDMAKVILPLPGIQWFMSTEFDTLDPLQKLAEDRAIDKLLIHGERDRVVPFRLGQKLYERLPPPKQKWYPKNVGHNDINIKAGERYQRRIHSLLSRL